MNRVTFRHTLAWTAVLTLGSAGTLAQTTGADLATETQAPNPESAVATDEPIGTFLDRLHDTHSTIQTLTARMIATTVYTLQGDLQTVRGSFAIQNDPPTAGAAGDTPTTTRRRIRIDFVDRITDGIIRDDRKSIVFDGEVLLEINHEDQQLIPRQIASPGTIIDPLAVDGAMIPIPVGQTRAEIQNAYDAGFADAIEGLGDDSDLGYELEPTQLGTLRSWVADAVQLVLRPHEGSKALEYYSLIRAWYDRDTLLPVLVVLSTAEENYEVIQLDSHRVNDRAALTNPRAFVTNIEQIRADYPGWQIRPLDPYRGTPEAVLPSSPPPGNVSGSTRVVDPAQPGTTPNGDSP